MTNNKSKTSNGEMNKRVERLRIKLWSRYVAKEDKSQFLTDLDHLLTQHGRNEREALLDEIIMKATTTSKFRDFRNALVWAVTELSGPKKLTTNKQIKEGK